MTVMLGAFMAVMDVSVVNVALPHMMGTFGEGLSAITWVATSYSIAEIIMLTMAGWWVTLLGRKRVYLFSILLFTVGSVLSGTARTFSQILFYRTLQGIGGGSLIPLSQAILRESFPEKEQGMAMAVYGMGVVLAPGFGVILGGWLTDHYGWPWIFFVNVPVALLAAFLFDLFVEDPAYLRRGLQKIDWLGIFLLALGLTLLQLFLERGQEKNWLDSSFIRWTGAGALASLSLLVFWELRAAEPVINLRLLRNIPLTVGSSLGFIFGIALFGSTFVVPQLVQQLLGYSAYQAGLILAPRALSLFFLMPVAGWLYNYVDSKILVFGGVLVMIASFFSLSHLSLQVGPWDIIPSLLLMGASMPFMFVTMTTVSLSTVARQDMTEASSFYTLARRVGGNVGYAVVTTLLARRGEFHFQRLAEQIPFGSGPFRGFHFHLAPWLTRHGSAFQNIPEAPLAVARSLLRRQAAILSYNDLSWFIAILFLFALPLIFLFPRKSSP